MKAVITSKFKVRDVPHESYYSFPVYSEHIEKTLIRELEFLKRHGTKFSLTLTIEGNNEH